MPEVRFQRVLTSRVVEGSCPVCGKMARRQKTFEHTVNPFNRTANGEVKTWAEVRADVNREANAWRPDFTHRLCKS